MTTVRMTSYSPFSEAAGYEAFSTKFHTLHATAFWGIALTTQPKHEISLSRKVPRHDTITSPRLGSLTSKRQVRRSKANTQRAGKNNRLVSQAACRTFEERELKSSGIYKSSHFTSVNLLRFIRYDVESAMHPAYKLVRNELHPRMTHREIDRLRDMPQSIHRGPIEP